jgi:hypothetical protein
VKVTLLWRPPQQSSFEAMAVRLLTAVPVYTASRVSKPEPAVSIDTGAALVAVQRYQTEAPPELPAWFGSPGSLVAPTLDPPAVPEAPASACALAKSSFAGAPAAFACTVAAQARTTASTARAVPNRNPTY